jgi:hypothetical protein
MPKRLNSSKSNIQSLVKEYQNLFPDPFGIECGDGWTELVRLICEFVKLNLERHQELKGFKFDQIKEKFGYLRVYYSTIPNIGDKKTYQEFYKSLTDFVYAIETVSGIVCEDCGKIKNDKLNIQIRTPRGYWKKTLCDKCFEKEKKAYKNGRLP